LIIAIVSNVWYIFHALPTDPIAPALSTPDLHGKASRATRLAF
jgi:hypothetical protein